MAPFKELPLHVQRRIMRRREVLEAKGFDGYAQYLASPTWEAVKERYRASDLPQDCMCGDTQVQMHHTTYDRVGGDELLSDLAPLCARCHTLVHVLEARGEVGLDLAGLCDEQRAARRRAEAAAQCSQRDRQRAAFHALPLAERIARLKALSRSTRVAIGRDLASVDRALQQRQRYRAAAWCDRRIEQVERSLTGDRPELLDELMPETPGVGPDLPVAIAPAPADCDGSMVCQCSACITDKQRLGRRGVRPRMAA